LVDERRIIKSIFLVVT